jgi:carbamoyl-phosphate synthase small subunit
LKKYRFDSDPFRVYFPNEPLKKAMLVLEDGAKFEGVGFGADGESYGEIVFNTSMGGYQEILTDPSYNGQIVVMTYPQIGNYGVNPEDVESRRPFVRGFVVREYSSKPSNWRASENLESYLKNYNIVGIQEIATRDITRRIRSQGAQRAVISTVDFSHDSLVKKVRSSPSILDVDLVTEVSCRKPYVWENGTEVLTQSLNTGPKLTERYKVVAYDYGIKQNILRRLVDVGCDVRVVPSETTSDEVLSMDPDGIVLSNGPGDPSAVSYAVKNVERLVGKKPIFGICLGHQILGLALGGKTFKLKFGHRGANQPVKNLSTGKVEITSQNHGFAVDPDSLGSDVEITHINLNDKTVEGLRHTRYPIISVQYHPEASPGPHDSSYLFDEFIRMMRNFNP